MGPIGIRPQRPTEPDCAIYQDSQMIHSYFEYKHYYTSASSPDKDHNYMRVAMDWICLPKFMLNP